MKTIIAHLLALFRRETEEIDFTRDVPPQQYHLTSIWDRGNVMKIGAYEDEWK